MDIFCTYISSHTTENTTQHIPATTGVIRKNFQPPVNNSPIEGHILTQESQNALHLTGTPHIPLTTTTLPSSPQPPTDVTADVLATNMTEDHPATIPYTGKCFMEFVVNHLLGLCQLCYCVHTYICRHTSILVVRLQNT